MCVWFMNFIPPLVQEGVFQPNKLYNFYKFSKNFLVIAFHSALDDLGLIFVYV